tara:strand:+ start:517 stop:627 length:111 start_codon:yes stop_codon:yes gene_type:complete
MLKKKAQYAAKKIAPPKAKKYAPKALKVSTKSMKKK